MFVFGGGRALPESVLGETESLRRWVKSRLYGRQHNSCFITKHDSPSVPHRDVELYLPVHEGECDWIKYKKKDKF